MPSSEGGPSPEHQRLVSSLIDYLSRNGWTVTHADGIAGYSRPDAVDGRIPDVVARDSAGVLAFGEAETCDFLDSSQTIDQIDAFSNRVMTQGRQSVQLFVIVPAACRTELATLIQTRFSNRSNIHQLYLPQG